MGLYTDILERNQEREGQIEHQNVLEQAKDKLDEKLEKLDNFDPAYARYLAQHPY